MPASHSSHHAIILLATIVATNPVCISAQQEPPDSIRTLREARAALRDHVRSLPAPGPRAAREASESRPEVIELLDSLALVIPGDDWIAGHRVGLRVMHDDLDAALATANECVASRWWCAALTGFVLHVRGDYQEAEAAFDRAMAVMPPEDRCDMLSDVRAHLLEGDAAGDFRGADCDRQIELARRFWWLADPFYLVPGNDRKSEHFARIVAMRMHHEYLALTGRLCSDTHHLATVLQGWPEWWWEPEGRTTDLTRGPGYRFLPRDETWVDPIHAETSEWSLSAGGFGERYDPAYGPVYELDGQVAFFARDDGVTVVAATDLADHALERSTIRDAALILALDEDTPPVITRGVTEGGRLVFRADAPEREYLVGIETLTDDAGGARARFGHGLPTYDAGGLALSDILLWEWRDGVRQELDAVAPLTIGSSRLAPGRTVGIYWEMYGLRDGEAVDISIQTVPTERGFLRRFGEALRLLTPPESLRFVWREGAPDDDTLVVGRTLELDLSGLSPGGYTLVLGVRAGAREDVVTTRAITLVDG